MKSETQNKNKNRGYELPKIKKKISREPLDTPIFKNKKNRINLIYDRHFENYEIEVIDLKEDKLESAYSYSEIIRNGFQPQETNTKLVYGTQPKLEPLTKTRNKIEKALKDATTIEYETIEIDQKQEPLPQEEVKSNDSTSK